LQKRQEGGKKLLTGGGGGGEHQQGMVEPWKTGGEDVTRKRGYKISKSSSTVGVATRVGTVCEKKKKWTKKKKKKNTRAQTKVGGGMKRKWDTQSRKGEKIYKKGKRPVHAERSSIGKNLKKGKKAGAKNTLKKWRAQKKKKQEGKAKGTNES